MRQPCCYLQNLVHTRVYNYHTPRCTELVHGGVQTVYIRVETKIANLQNKLQKHAN